MASAEEKVAQSRLSVLELAEQLGNVAEACRRRGMNRQSFYIYKARFAERGIEGLKDLPPIHLTHPQTTPPEIEEKVVQYAMNNPRKGCHYISAQLAHAGIRISGITVRRILQDRKLGTRMERWLALEKQAEEKGEALTDKQTRFVEEQNPQYKERHVESSAPGELINQDTYFVGNLAGIGKVYMHSVVDTFGSMAWGFLHPSKQPEAAAVVLHNEVLPFYRKHKLQVKTILTDNGREFCGTDAHPYELYLRLNEIGHRRIRPHTPQTNGFVERFHKTAGEEFFEVALNSKPYLSVEALQMDLDKWLHHYNYERHHLGYRNQGRRPFDTVQQALINAQQAIAGQSALPTTPPNRKSKTVK